MYSNQVKHSKLIIKMNDIKITSGHLVNKLKTHTFDTVMVNIDVV